MAAMIDQLLAGVYQHHKGPLYLVLGLAHDANTTESFYKRDGKDAGMRQVVVYVGLELDDAHHGARLAVRTVEDFFQNVCTNAKHDHYGKVWHDGDATRPSYACYPRKRFTYIGPTWEGQL